jgi:glycosyltransferase involved in cell wall biosynthesis
MRVAVVTHSATHAGGVETYVAGVVPALAARGHAVGCLFEGIAPGSPRILPPAHRDPAWICGADPGRAVASLADWRPDVIYLQGLRSVSIERQLTAIAPVAFFAHSYYGACVSGERSTRFPVVSTCDRTFGAACLARYFPRRCGGLSPVTMARQYAVQRARQQLLHAFAVVLVGSGHMQRLYARQGVDARVISYPVAPAGVRTRGGEGGWNLLFLGRLERSKGVDVLLASTAIAAARLDRPVRLVIAGEGSLGDRLRGQAAAVMAANPRLTIELTGWLTDSARSAALSSADLLLVPSRWPEPFGLVGVEAGSAGVPAIAFDVGGIDAWLSDRINGRLVAPGASAVQRFADTVVETLADLPRLEEMRTSAAASAGRFTMSRHLDALERHLEEAAAIAAPAGCPS